jgi:hypothetical protein
MKNEIFLSIVIPTIGKSNLLVETILTIEKLMKEKKFSYEIIIVDDYSEKNIGELLSNISQKNIQVFRLSRNTGQLIATIIGLNQSKGNIIITLDDDLNYHPRNILKGIERLNSGVLLVYGSDGYNKLNLNKIYKLIASVFLFPRFINYEVSSFRIIDKNLLNRYSTKNVIGSFWQINNNLIGVVKIEKERIINRKRTIISIFRHQSFFLVSLLKRIVLILFILLLVKVNFFLAILIAVICIFLLTLEIDIKKRINCEITKLI